MALPHQLQYSGEQALTSPEQHRRADPYDEVQASQPQVGKQAPLRICPEVVWMWVMPPTNTPPPAAVIRPGPGVIRVSELALLLSQLQHSRAGPGGEKTSEPVQRVGDWESWPSSSQAVALRRVDPVL